MRRFYHVLGGLGVVAAAWFVVGAEDQPIGEPAEAPYLTVFMVDGLSREVFETELAAGHMPNVSRLIEEGQYVERGVSAFPSMTGYGFWPLITGEDATHSGVLGLRWFDRAREIGVFRSYVGQTNVEMNDDLSERKTLFEHFAEQHSLTINSYNNRGAIRSVKTGFKFTAAKYEGHWWVADLLSMIPVFEDELSPDWREVELFATTLATDDLVHRPKIQWITFVSPDTYAHVNGVGPRYAELVRIVDEMVGVYRERAAAMGLDEDRVYAFVSDHGVETTKRNVDLIEAFEAVDIPAWRGSATVLGVSRMSDAFEDFAPYDVVLAINGNLMNYVYVRDPATSGAAGWRTRPSTKVLRAYGDQQTDLVKVTLEAEGIAQVILRDDQGGVEIHALDGIGRIRTSSTGLAHSYRVEGVDPLGYTGAAASLVDGAFHSAAEWLDATKATDHPYAVVRVARLMAKEGAGDMVVTSAEGYDLAKEYELFVGNYAGGHGGLRASQLLVPYVIAGPGVPRGRVEAATVEDAGATLLTALGIKTDDVMGRPIVPTSTASR